MGLSCFPGPELAVSIPVCAVQPLYHVPAMLSTGTFIRNMWYLPLLHKKVVCGDSLFSDKTIADDRHLYAKIPVPDTIEDYYYKK